MPDPSVFVVHNHYQKPGGEDEVVRVETAMLRSRGHDVREFRLHNDAIDQMSTPRLVRATLWNDAVHRDLQERLGTSQVAHFHNTFPLISPAAYYAARRRGVPVVQTLHNYRLLCPSAVFYRDGGVCEECLGRSISWPAVVHGCYRGSRTATLAVAGMTAMHRAMGTWTNDGRSLHRAHRVRPTQVHRRWTSGEQDRREAQLHRGSRSRRTRQT